MANIDIEYRLFIL